MIKRQMSGRWTALEFCRREGLALSTFHWWRRRLATPVRDAVEWIEVAEKALLPAAPAGGGPAVRVGTGSGLWVEFAVPPAAELLAAALRALHPEGGAAC